MIPGARDRLLIVGIDAATPDLVRRWARRGDLPTLGRLMRDGVYGPLRSVPNMITPAAWSSFATGCNPAKHGIFFFTERVPGSYAERFINGAARVLPAFWSIASQRQVRSIVVNVPMTFPADPINGVMVSGMDAPSPDDPGFTHPPELAPELRARFDDLLGPAAFSGAIGHLVMAGHLGEALALLEQRVAARTDLLRYLMEQYPADLVTMVHTEVDSVQHYFWKFMDPRLPGYSPRLAQRFGDSILRIYQAVDQSLEAMLRAFGPCNVMVVSDHGMGPSPGGSDGVPWIRLVLEALGLSVRAQERNAARAAARRAAAAIYRSVNPRLPRSIRAMARRAAPGALDAFKGSAKYRLEWSRTKAFCLGAAGDVWINLRGRDPEGIVEPGEDYDRIRREIREAFLSLRDASSGDPVVEAVEFREEVYDGPYADRGPDLLIRFRDVVVEAVKMRGRVLRLPRRNAASPQEVKSGSHRPYGIVMLSGTGVRQSAEIAGARLIDVAPTILYWLGLPIPMYMDGAALKDAFLPAYLAANPGASESVRPEAAAIESAGYTAEEEAVLTERLRRLGYV